MKRTSDFLGLFAIRKQKEFFKQNESTIDLKFYLLNNAFSDSAVNIYFWASDLEKFFL